METHTPTNTIKVETFSYIRGNTMNSKSPTVISEQLQQELDYLTVIYRRMVAAQKSNPELFGKLNKLYTNHLRVCRELGVL